MAFPSNPSNGDTYTAGGVTYVYDSTPGVWKAKTFDTVDAGEALTKIKTVDGSGSGLDADTLDGLSSSSFLRGDSNATINGTLIVDGGVGVGSTGIFHVRQNGDTSNNGIAITSSNSTSHRIWKDSSGGINIGPSSNPSALHQDLNGVVSIGGNTGAISGEKLRVSDTGTFVASFQRTDGTPHVLFKGNDAGTGRFYLSGEVLQISQGDASGSQDGAIWLQGNSNGHVGVGTSNPTMRFHVNSGSTNVTSRFESSDSEAWIDLRDSNSGAYGCLIGHSSSHLFRVADSNVTDRFRVSPQGYVTKPYHPAFDAGMTSRSVSGIISYNSIHLNNGNHFNGTRFTAPVSGIYQFFTSYIKDNANGTVCRRRFLKNGSSLYGSRHLRLDTNQTYGDNGALTYIMSLSAGDYVEVEQFAGTSYGGADYDFFSGTLIG